MHFSVHEAKTHFSKLLHAMEQGHEVVITNGRERVPVAQLVPAKRKGGIQLGLYAASMGSMSDEAVLAPTHSGAELLEMNELYLFPE